MSSIDHGILKILIPEGPSVEIRFVVGCTCGWSSGDCLVEIAFMLYTQVGGCMECKSDSKHTLMFRGYAYKNRWRNAVNVYDARDIVSKPLHLLTTRKSSTAPAI